jgi:hypothetical protein
MDIGYDVSKLSNVAILPATNHYSALKLATRYLHQNCGFIYWHPDVLINLPRMSFPLLWSVDALNYTLPFPKEIDQHYGYLDASHVNYLRTQLYGDANDFYLCVVMISYYAKWISTVCFSSTEMEFVTDDITDKYVVM